MWQNMQYIQSDEDLPYELGKAYQIAISGRKGPRPFRHSYECILNWNRLKIIALPTWCGENRVSSSVAQITKISWLCPIERKRDVNTLQLIVNFCSETLQIHCKTLLILSFTRFLLKLKRFAPFPLIAATYYGLGWANIQSTTWSGGLWLGRMPYGV